MSVSEYSASTYSAGLTSERTRGVTVALLIVFLALAWSYGGELFRLSGRWLHADYAHGFLVLPFAFYLAWKRRDILNGRFLKGSLIGFVLIVLAIVMQCVSAYFSDPILTPLSLVPCLAGIALVFGGWNAIHWLWPSLLFLVFMIPLPDFMASWGNLILQRIATVSSTFLLQALGVPAVSTGNVIVLTNTELGVEEACSGLRSTIVFLAVSVGAALMIKGTPERVAVMLAAIPAAILANVIRIVATGLLYQYASAELADAVFHDFFGFLMLPLAAGMAWLLVILTRALFVPVDEGPVQPGMVSAT
jgi:exosortase